MERPVTRAQRGRSISPTHDIPAHLLGVRYYKDREERKAREGAAAAVKERDTEFGIINKAPIPAHATSARTPYHKVVFFSVNVGTFSFDEIPASRVQNLVRDHLLAQNHVQAIAIKRLVRRMELVLDEELGGRTLHVVLPRRVVMGRIFGRYKKLYVLQGSAEIKVEMSGGLGRGHDDAGEV